MNKSTPAEQKDFEGERTITISNVALACVQRYCDLTGVSVHDAVTKALLEWWDDGSGGTLAMAFDDSNRLAVNP